ncbi:MAG TPA: SpoIIE family protein phosphatase, partial [Terriglobales bacterium]|nr:SpoIIE family protein phosphatase [Terriglobales bacterium]
MASTLFALVALVLAFLALRSRARIGPRSLAIALTAGGIAWAALTILERTALGLAGPAQDALMIVAALAALALWGSFAVLAFHEVRRRDLYWIAPFGLLALLSLGAPAREARLAFLLSWPVVARWRWLDRIGQRALAATFFAGLVLVVLAVLPLPTHRGALSPLADTLHHRIAWARTLAAFYLFFALPGTLRRWSVGIRRVSRRLAVLLALSSAVPLLLIVVLWVSTTLLGVGGERALIGARLLDQRARQLQASLAALPPGPERVESLARAHPRWPGLRLWSGGTRLHGASIDQEAGIAAWPDSSRQHGLVRIGRASWIGARARRPGSLEALVVLIPVDEFLRADADSLLGARLSLLAGDTTQAADSLEDVARSAAGSLAPPGAEDSLESPVERVDRERRSGGVRISVDEHAPALSSGEFRFGAGHAVIEGVAWSRGRWRRAQALLNVDVPWTETLAGLARNVRENPFNVLPLFLLAVLAAFILMLAAVDFAMVRALGRSITEAVGALGRGAGRLESGDLSYRIPVAGEDDLWDVAAAFNRMAAGLERGRQLEIDRQRIEDELALARRIQARLLPPGPPRVPGLELAGISEPAREVGGDYYDFVPLGGDRVALVIADVSGKGVGAALLMSGFRASLLSQDLDREDVARVLERLNAFLHRSVEPGKFVTAFLGVLHARTGRLVYCNAGHNPPLVSRGSPADPGRPGTHERLEAGGLILGILEQGRY